MSWYIRTGNCCGDHCAYAWENANARTFSSYYPDYTESVDGSDEWGLADNDPKKAILAFQGKLKAIKQLLAKLLKEGKITQEEADARLEEWMRENPDPELEVSKALEAQGQPIPVVLPQKEKVNP